MEHLNRTRFRLKYKQIIFPFLIAVLSFAFLPAVRAQAAKSITRLTFNGQDYYLTSNQMDYVNQLTDANDYIGVAKFIESLGEDAHYFAIENGVLYGGVGKENPQIKELKIPNSVHTIAKCAFQGCDQFVKISMSDSVKVLEYGAFADCSSLKSVKLSKNLTYIGKYAFQNCNKLTSISLPSKLTTIEYAAFLNCTSLKSVTLPKSVTTVKEFAFYGCSKLKSIKMLANVSEIGESALYDCKSLQNVITTQGSYAEAYAKENLNCAIIYTSKVTMANKVQYLLVGDTYNSMVYNASGKRVTYSSTNKKVATVDKNGKVKAVSNGKATIQAVVDGKTVKCSVIVLKRSVDNRVKQFAKNYTKPEMSDYQIITLAHEWLIKNVSYDSKNYENGSVPKVSHTAQGALLNGVAVCDGYAYGFQKIMDYFHIPNNIVIGKSNGEGHAWNLVKIKDQWYQIDVTYDDPIINGKNQNIKVYKNYFLINDEQMKKDHTWNSDKYEKCTATKIDKDYVSKR